MGNAKKELVRAPSVTAFAGGGRSFETLSPGLQGQAVRRLGSLAALLTGLFIGTTVLRNLAFHLETGLESLHLVISNIFSVAFAFTSLALYFFARRSRNHTLVLRVGLAYEVLACLSVALLEAFITDFSHPIVRLSLIALFIMIFPVAVPARPRIRIGTTLLSYLTLPAAIYIARAFGKPLDHVVFVLLPTLTATIAALMVSWIVHGMNVQLQRARTLGAYELVKKLGEGGMGEVWLGKHRMLARPAAIKLVSRERVGMNKDVALLRFEREAQATSLLRSPHTVELYDFGVSDDGVFYYVMELLLGADLQSTIKEHGPMPAGRVIHILRQACKSLGEAHGRRLVHRDIKPGNLFLCNVGSDLDYVKVLDFGLVKPETTAETAKKEIELTLENAVTGTPAYMAPEVAMTRKVDHRADIYALGCVGYFLLTGELVFDGETPIQVAMKHVSDTPVPPSERTELDIPHQLDVLILRCLAKDPDDRPVSADALGALLGELAEHYPWTPAQAEQWWKANLPDLVAPPAPGVESTLTH